MGAVTPYSAMVVEDLLDAFMSSDPLPGGGSAAALAGALGVSLLLMVAGMTRTRSGTPEEGADLSEASSRLRPLRDTLMDLVERDSEAYRTVIDALKLPKETDADKRARTDAIQAALVSATATPMDTLRACQQALRGAIVVAKAGSKNAASDAGVGVELLLAAARGAALNVDTNLPGIKDAALVERTRAERQELEAECVADAGRARAAL